VLNIKVGNRIVQHVLVILWVCGVVFPELNSLTATDFVSDTTHQRPATINSTIRSRLSLFPDTNTTKRPRLPVFTYKYIIHKYNADQRIPIGITWQCPSTEITFSAAIRSNGDGRVVFRFCNTFVLQSDSQLPTQVVKSLCSLA
jgi:hypothetical protein